MEYSASIQCIISFWIQSEMRWILSLFAVKVPTWSPVLVEFTVCEPAHLHMNGRSVLHECRSKEKDVLLECLSKSSWFRISVLFEETFCRSGITGCVSHILNEYVIDIVRSGCLVSCLRTVGNLERSWRGLKLACLAVRGELQYVLDQNRLQTGCMGWVSAGKEGVNQRVASHSQASVSSCYLVSSPGDNSGNYYDNDETFAEYIVRSNRLSSIG